MEWAMAAGAAADGLFGMGTQAMTNHANKQASEAQMNFNREMWHLNNEYNKPINQMARLKEAGLNPNLIYGSGVSGATGLSSSPAKSYTKPEYRLEFGTPFQNFVQLKYLNAQTDNVKASTEVKEQEQLLKNAQTAESLSRNAKNQADLYKFKELKDMSLSALEQRIKESEQTTIGKALENSYLQQAEKDRVLLIKASTEQAKATLQGQKLLNKLRQLEVNLNQMGIQKSDNMLYRMLIQMLFNPDYVDNLDSSINRLKQ